MSCNLLHYMKKCQPIPISVTLLLVHYIVILAYFACFAKAVYLSFCLENDFVHSAVGLMCRIIRLI